MLAKAKYSLMLLGAQLVGRYSNITELDNIHLMNRAYIDNYNDNLLQRTCKMWKTRQIPQISMCILFSSLYIIYFINYYDINNFVLSLGRYCSQRRNL